MTKRIVCENLLVTLPTHVYVKEVFQKEIQLILCNMFSILILYELSLFAKLERAETIMKYLASVDSLFFSTENFNLKQNVVSCIKYVQSLKLLVNEFKKKKYLRIIVFLSDLSLLKVNILGSYD